MTETTEISTWVECPPEAAMRIEALDDDGVTWVSIRFSEIKAGWIIRYGDAYEGGLCAVAMQDAYKATDSLRGYSTHTSAWMPLDQLLGE
jgi:hypothetical protein